MYLFVFLLIFVGIVCVLARDTDPDYARSKAQSPLVQGHINRINRQLSELTEGFVPIKRMHSINGTHSHHHEHDRAHHHRAHFCNNFTVEEVKQHMIQTKNKIEKAHAEGECQSWFEHNRKWKEMYRCKHEWWPNIMGHNYTVPTYDVNSMRIPSTNWYWIAITPIEWYGNFYLDFLIFEKFFRRSDRVLYDGTYLETGKSTPFNLLVPLLVRPPP
jgi:hypothetical protein